MGYNSAKDILDRSNLDTALAWHLESNLYPPIPLSMIPIAKAAIEAANDNMDLTVEIPLPEGITWRGKSASPAHAIIRSLHLDAFLEPCDE